MSRRIGILGGTFDPIHMGHLITAEIVRVSAALDEIIFIPAARPPHKENKGEAPAEDRLLMVQCAVEGNPSFSVSDIELKREGPSYTVDTIAVLSEQLRGAELFFITGADAMNDLYRWHDPVRLLHSCTFIVAARQGVELDESRLAEQFSPEQRSRIRIVPTPHLEISSTMIRMRVRAGMSIRYLVPRAVEHYIEERGLYRAHDKKL